MDGKPVQGSRSEVAFLLIEEMFSLEQAWKDQLPEARFTLRQEKLRPLLAMGDRCWKRTAITICPAIGWAIGNAISSRTDCPFTTVSRMMCDAGRIGSHSDLFGK